MLDRIIMAGSGGQGIQFAGQLLALAAVEQGLEATCVPAYGAERRGGSSFCTVVVSDHNIYAPIFKEADVLLAFNQQARNEYAAMVKDTGIIIADLTLAPAANSQEKAKVIMVPALEEAFALRKEVSAQNLVMIGAYSGLNRGITLESVRQVLADKSKKKPHLLRTNSMALEKGAQLVTGNVL